MAEAVIVLVVALIRIQVVMAAAAAAAIVTVEAMVVVVVFPVITRKNRSDRAVINMLCKACIGNIYSLIHIYFN